MDHIEKKKKDIDEAMTHRYTDSEIEQVSHHVVMLN